VRAYKNILFIGTSHIAKQSIREITEQFASLNPDIICVELDNKRLHGLVNNEKPNYSLIGIKYYGLQGYMFAVLGSLLQKRMGNIVGVSPGSDMLTAVNLAKRNGKRLELIDQNIDITLRRFSKSFTMKEKAKMLYDIMRSPFSKKMQINLNNVPKEEVIEKLMQQLKDRYPKLYSVLVEERNYVMAKNIYRIMSQNPDKKILVVIGAGHELELIKLVKQEGYRHDRIT